MNSGTIKRREIIEENKEKKEKIRHLFNHR